MRSEVIAEVSRSNFDAAVETFLRATDVIHDSETPQSIRYTFKPDNLVQITILLEPQEVAKAVDQTVH